jgi:hypothetical protein
VECLTTQAEGSAVWLSLHGLLIWFAFASSCLVPDWQNSNFINCQMLGSEGQLPLLIS